jgi:hypothetical protein
MAQSVETPFLTFLFFSASLRLCGESSSTDCELPAADIAPGAAAE